MRSRERRRCSSPERAVVAIILSLSLFGGPYAWAQQTVTSATVLRGFQLSYIFTYASRLPFNVLLGNDRNLDTNNNDRPPGVGRNTGRGFDYASLDLRIVVVSN